MDSIQGVKWSKGTQPHTTAQVSWHCELSRYVQSLARGLSFASWFTRITTQLSGIMKKKNLPKVSWTWHMRIKLSAAWHGKETVWLFNYVMNAVLLHTDDIIRMPTACANAAKLFRMRSQGPFDRHYFTVWNKRSLCQSLKTVPWKIKSPGHLIPFRCPKFYYCFFLLHFCWCPM